MMIEMPLENYRAGTSDQMSDTLIARARDKDVAAIGTLYEHYWRMVFHFLYYQVGDQHTAEDLTTDVFLRMIQALPRYRQRGVPFQAWLFQIARNLAVDHFRKMDIRNHVELDENLTTGDQDLDIAAEHSLTRERLRQALMRLTEDQRHVIVLRFVVEMPIAQVAHTLDKSESAVKALQRRGLEALRRILADWKVSYG
jgi:RNA polymerase sigma-70 factor (ECF subfamily)